MKFGTRNRSSLPNLVGCADKLNMDNTIQLYLPPAALDRASGRIDLQINGVTVAEWHDKLIRRECEMSAYAQDEIATVICEFWKVEQSEYHYRSPGEVDLGEI